MQKFHFKLYKRFSWYAKATDLLKNIVVPGFGGVPIFYVISFFIREMLNENVNTRASATAFNFFIALFPALIFLFTLIPYMPLDDLHDQIIDLFRQMLPENAFLTIISVLEDILSTRRGGLLSFGFLFTLFFATNGVYGLMEAFNKHDPRSFWKKRLIALGLTVAFSFILIIGFSLSIFGSYLMNFLFNFSGAALSVMLEVLRWVLIMLIVFGSIIMLYYFASFPRRPLRLYVSGTILATILSVLASQVFTYYVENFAQYHYLYGSIGTIIIMMLWIYFQSIVLIIGYELNHSILLARDSLTDDSYL